ncbi:hypothetical protein [Halorussus pelagicus]|uniref:hypothetical protein n=1 Tax=Halorussus pelagicus TaxID=2505977 RepID=UPI000FFBD030|nr:hypothetical protein [Halorussus pelagicus]
MLGRNLLRSGNAGVPNVSYYDLVLAVVPLPLLVGFFADAVLAVPNQTATMAGGVVSALVVGHLLFGDPPTRRGPRGSERAGESSVEGSSAGSSSVSGGSVGNGNVGTKTVSESSS